MFNELMKAPMALAMLLLIGGAARADMDTAQKGSLLVFSNVEVRWDYNGNLLQDTFITLHNDYPDEVIVQMYFVMGDPEFDEPGARLHPGWNFEGRAYWMDSSIQLTPHQPVHWSALTGLSDAGPQVPPWTWLDPGDPPGRPDPDVPGERMLRGFIYAWAVDHDTGEEIHWNHLAGGMTVVRYDAYAACEYPALAFQTIEGSNGEPTGSPGELHLDDDEYEAPRDFLLLDFYAVGGSSFSGPADVFPDTDLTLHHVALDMRQDHADPIVTSADITIWNAWEVKFSGVNRCVTCWDQTLLSDYGMPLFWFEHLQTDKGKARIDGVEDYDCEGSVPSALAGVSSNLLTFDASPDETMTGSSLVGVGDETAILLFNPMGQPPPRRSHEGRGGGTAALPSTPNRVKTSVEGSLLIYPNVELRWDDNGNLVQDTFISLLNDWPEDVDVRLYLVQGDEPLEEDPPERAHTGWNWIDETITLTMHQPTYWSASTGLGDPGPAVPPWTDLDPGNPPGRPATDGTTDRVLRGFLCAWAIDSETGEEIRWDHLSGGAVVINYADHSAWEYDPYVHMVVDPFVGNGEPTGTPGILNMDGQEYDQSLQFLTMDFFSVGSTALSDPDANTTVDVDTDLTLLPVSLDLRQDAGGPVVTEAKFDVWNTWEMHFTGAYRCVTFWDQTLLRLYDVPNLFMIETLQTDKAEARLHGASGELCGPDSQYVPLLGAVRKQLSFNDGAGIEASGRVLAGMGLEDGVLMYDPRTYCDATSLYCEEYISRVEVGGIDHSSGCDNYADFTDISTEMVVGIPYDMTITITNGLASNEGAVWIDWNRDFDFYDDGELIAVEGSPGQGPYTATVIPPEDAVLGDTRMRIRLLWYDPIDPCGTTNYGEVEDYTITVTDSPTYCEASGGCEEHIARVQVGAIDNASACDGYADYTDLSTEMAIGSEYDITVTVGDPFDDQDQGGIWVDWNGDGDFEDAAETIAVEGSPGYGPYTATISPPEGAALDETRLRVRVRWEGTMDPCGTTDYGEVEDYTVVVVQESSCPADFDGDGDVDTADLLFLLACWGTPCGDVDFDDDTDTADLLALLAAWGECP